MLGLAVRLNVRGLCFVVVPDMHLIADYAGQIALGKRGRITGGFTHMSPGVSVMFLHWLIS